MFYSFLWLFPDLRTVMKWILSPPWSKAKMKFFFQKTQFLLDQEVPQFSLWVFSGLSTELKREECIFSAHNGFFMTTVWRRWCSHHLEVRSRMFKKKLLLYDMCLVKCFHFSNHHRTATIKEATTFICFSQGQQIFNTVFLGYPKNLTF